MYYIRVYLGDELISQLELPQKQIAIGRTEDNEIVLPEAGVSRTHALIEHDGGDYYIVDNGSRNGVFVNNQKVDKVKLKYWDEIQVHNYVLKVMSKPGIGESKDPVHAGSEVQEGDKTQFFNVSNEKELDELRKQTKQSFLTFMDDSNSQQTFLITNPRTIIGKSKTADIKIGGLFAPAVAAVIERHGSGYELMPSKRGKVIFRSQYIDGPARLKDDSGFIVRGKEFRFYNRLTKAE